MSVLNDKSYSAYSEMNKDSLSTYFFFLEDEKENKKSIHRFNVQFKGDSLYVIYDKKKDSVLTTIKKGYKGKQKKSFWRFYSSFRIIPLFPIFSDINIYRIRIKPNENGDLVVEKFIDRGLFILAFGDRKQYEYKDIYKEVDKSDKVIPFYEQGYYGLSYKGKIILPPTYSYMTSFEDNFSIVEKNKKYGTINEKGESIIPLEYEYLKYDKSFGVFLVKKEQRYGFLDLEGNVRIPHIYTKIEKNALNGYFLELGDKVGYVKFLSIYSSENIFIPAIYSKIEKKSLHNKYILVYDGLTPLFVDGIGNQYKANVINMKKIEAFSESAEEKDGVKINNTIYYPDLSSKSNITKKEMLHPILEIAPK
jgi:KWG repeat domain protein